MRRSGALSLAVVLFAALLVPVAVAADAPPARAAGGPTAISGDISSSETWSTAGSPYLLTGQVRVLAGVRVTVEPGVVVKMAPGAGSRVVVLGGQLVASGTPTAPIVFTSGADDSVGGDSNGDGSATTPKAGDWYDIAFGPALTGAGAPVPTSVLKDVIVRYGGASSGFACQTYGAVTIQGQGSAVVSQSEFRDIQGAGVQIEAGAAYASVSHSLFTSSGCGMGIWTGSVTDNVFDASISQDAAWFMSPTGVRFEGNWVAGQVRHNATSTPVDNIVSGNALLGGVSDQSNGHDLPDLSDNWWGHVVADPPPYCYDFYATYIPAVATQTAWGSGCYYSTIITGYFTKVLPALTSAPVQPQAGIGAGSPLSAAEEAGGGNPAENTCPCRAADPVDTYTGEFFESATDLSLPGAGPAMGVSRTYSSTNALASGPFGFGWSSPLLANLSASTSGDVVVTQENGSQVTFTEQADGSYQAPARVHATLNHDEAPEV